MNKEALFDYLEEKVNEIAKNELEENEFTIQEFMARFNKTETTARRILEKMKKQGTLTERKIPFKGHLRNIYKVVEKTQ